MGIVFQVLALVRKLSQIEEPVSSENGFRQYLEVFLEFSSLAGLPDVIVDKIDSALSNPTIFNLALAVVRFLYGFVDQTTFNAALDGTGSKTVSVVMVDCAPGDLDALDAKSFYDLDISAQSVQEWMVIIGQLIAIIEAVRKRFPRV